MTIPFSQATSRFCIKFWDTPKIIKASVNWSKFSTKLLRWLGTAALGL